ncbi:MAG: hypothetical protein LH629_05225, partial [Ignavibacteria bacterium]|nr:hypothetical protein [Ignavibacteria bacterium]
MAQFTQLSDYWKTYEGEFRDGKKWGLGVMNFGTCKYHGNFENDVFHGNGAVINEKDDKILIKGTWKMGS